MKEMTVDDLIIKKPRPSSFLGFSVRVWSEWYFLHDFFVYDSESLSELPTGRFSQMAKIRSDGLIKYKRVRK